MAIRNTERFAELEYSLSVYFRLHLSPVMTSVQRDLQQKQIQEIAEYKSSTAGILDAMAEASRLTPGMDTTLQKLQLTGKWNSKTTDDYLDMVRKEIAGDKAIQKDIAVLASEWRKAVIDEVGREAYDKASRQIGADLAYAYLDHRLEEQMMEKMVSDRMPKSSVEYVLRRAGERSILGLNSLLLDCPADHEINDRIEARYLPSTLEKGAVRGTSFAMDVVTMGGASSWGALVKMAGAEVVFSGLEAYATRQDPNKKQMSVEECISQGVFGSKTNVFPEFRKDPSLLRTWEHPHLIALNRQLSRKLGIAETKPVMADNSIFLNPSLIQSPFPMKPSSSPSEQENNRNGIPLVIAHGKEEEYRDFKRRNAERTSAMSLPEEKGNEKTEPVQQLEPAPIMDSISTSEGDISRYTERQEDANLSGWDGLLKTFGLDGLSGTGRNLGYVIAMLPDVLFGALTGKSKKLGLEDNLIPIASVLAGFFVRNPLLKMTLIGLGGANLLNKAGKEALGSQVQAVREVQYKRYADEPLNARIAGLSIQGNALLCTIDRVPCTISLPPATVEAYHKGALPLNTLANAILVRHDAMQEELANAYQQQYEHARQQSLTTGIK